MHVPFLHWHNGLRGQEGEGVREGGEGRKGGEGVKKEGEGRKGEEGVRKGGEGRGGGVR